LQTKADPRATRVAVVPVWVAVIPIIVRMPPVIIGVIVPIILACIITMMASTVTTVLLVPRPGFSHARKKGYTDPNEAQVNQEFFHKLLFWVSVAQMQKAVRSITNRR
jgi:hypothetical protein